MVNPQVSVIVPVYKSAAYLRRCLDSIIAQSFSDFELILVSDGPELEHQICDEYASKDARVLVLKDVKKGLGGARNAGLLMAKGKYILFVDSDDYIAPETLKEAVSKFSSSVDIVIFGANVVVEKGAKVQKGLLKYLAIKEAGLKEVSQDLIFTTNVYSWNKLWRKDLIDKFNIRYPECLQYEDFPFFYAYMCCAQKVYFIDEKFYNYIQRKDSGMAVTFCGKMEFIKQHIDALVFLYNQLQSSGVYDSVYFSKIVSIILYAGMRYCRQKEDKREYLKYAHELLIKLPIQFELNSSLIALKKKDFDKIINKIDREEKKGIFVVRYTTNNKKKIYLFGKLLVCFMKKGEKDE